LCGKKSEKKMMVHDIIKSVFAKLPFGREGKRKRERTRKNKNDRANTNTYETHVLHYRGKRCKSIRYRKRIEECCSRIGAERVVKYFFRKSGLKKRDRDDLYIYMD